MSFNPFNKNFNQLEYPDLETLICDDVAEGWTLEYKSEIVKSKDIAKSIASFANSEGGWYIVGIKEKEKTNIAEKIVDLDLNKYKKPENTINNAIKSNVKPIPTFYTKLLKNPHEDNKGVVVVYIEKGYDVPYLTNDGKIYCRVGESSDPDVLKDRYLFEKLMERKDEINNKLDNFTQNNFDMPTNVGNPLLELNVYLKHGQPLYFEDFYLKEFVEKLKDNFTKPVPIFNGIASASLKNMEIIPTQNSYILNFKGENDSITFVNPMNILEIYNQGHMKFRLILPKLVDRYSNEYYYLFEHMLESEINDLNIIDFNTLVTTFSILINQYINLVNGYEFNNSFYLSLELINYDLSVIYFDNEKLINEILDKIIPVNIKTKVSTPYDAGYVELNNSDFNFEKFLVILLQTFGIPLFLVEDFLKGIIDYFKKIESMQNE